MLKPQIQLGIDGFSVNYVPWETEPLGCNYGVVIMQ